MAIYLDYTIVPAHDKEKSPGSSLASWGSSMRVHLATSPR